LVQADRSVVAREITARISAFTSDWKPPPRGDAGTALVKLFSEQAEPVLQRVNRLPEKQLVELLRTAGVEPAPPTPASAILELTVSPAAPQSVLVPRGFQVGARPANGKGDLVIFETDADLWAAPATIGEKQLQEGERFRLLAGDGRLLPFGADAPIGAALWIGLASASAPTPELALGFELTPLQGRPPPVSAGGVAPLPLGPAPLLSWEFVDQDQFVRAEVIEDGTANLQRSGILRLRAPRQWRPGRPAGMAAGAPFRWLRVRIAAGRFSSAPSLELIKINVVHSIAARTIFGEVLEPVPDGGGRRFRVSQVPVLPGSMVIEIDEGDAGGALQQWTEVSDLRQWGPETRVFELDAASGEVRFGDGIHGAEVPRGFRNVVAARYQTGGGASGAVDKDQITTLLKSAPFVTQATNPLPASGGTDEEPREETLLRGPQEIRARDRAVTLADYELLALRASGAQVARAHAVSGLHPALPGRAIPGVVGVLVVPPARGSGPYLPDELTLGAVATWLSEKVAPAGVTVVAGAPRYHLVRVEAQVVIEPTVDEVAAITAALDALNTYVDPLRGGDDGQGWPFGGTLRYAPLVRLLLDVQVGGRRALSAVPLLALVVDGLRADLCSDRPIPAHDLLWPTSHSIVPLPRSKS
jgi:predicted phage baseplate assembly protein